MSVPRRGEVYLVSLEPTAGREIRRTRPAVVVSPDQLNEHLGTYLIAPMTTGGHAYPFRIPCRFRKRDGFVVLDQIRAVDRVRLVRKLRRLSAPTVSRALFVLHEMFED